MENDNAYYNARNCLMFNEHRRLYMGIADDDARRLAGIYDMGEDAVRATLTEVEAALEKSAERVLSTVSAGRPNLRMAIAGEPLRIVAVGDSNTSFRLSWINVLRKALARIGCFEVADTSIPGLNTQDVVDHFADQLGAREADAAVMMIGTNDVRRSELGTGRTLVTIAEFKENVAFILDRFAERRIPLVVSTIAPIDGETMGKTFAPCRWGARDREIEAYNEVIGAEAKKRGARVADLYCILKDKKRADFLSDGLHLTSAAQETLAALMLGQLIPALGA